MRITVAITKALADENRQRILAALEYGERCVREITELLNLSPATVSKHLSILYHARLVDSRKEGRWVYCRLADEDSSPVVREALTLGTEFASGRSCCPGRRGTTRSDQTKRKS